MNLATFIGGEGMGVSASNGTWYPILIDRLRAGKIVSCDNREPVMH